MVLPQNISEVIMQLDLIVKQAKEQSDRMGYFAALYKRVTIEVEQRIKAGYFDDNPRMENLDVLFANRFIQAYHDFQAGNKCSLSWEQTFRAAKWWSPLTVQHLFVAINAHIGFDLGIAASQTQPDNIEDLQHDFNKINEVLASLIDEVQDELGHIFWPIKPMDWLLGGADEKIAKFAMNYARDEAWKVAVAHAALATEQEQQAYRVTRDATVAHYGQKIIQPKGLIRFLIRLFRPLEYGSVRYKIQVLDR